MTGRTTHLAETSRICETPRNTSRLGPTDVAEMNVTEKSSAETDDAQTNHTQTEVRNPQQAPAGCATSDAVSTSEAACSPTRHRSDRPSAGSRLSRGLRIALVRRHCSLQRGGSERFCANLARALSSRGFRVTVIAESIDGELADELDFVPVPVRHATSWTRNRSFAVNAGRAASNGQYDLVYALGRAFGADVVRITERLQSHWLAVRYRPAVWRWIQACNPRHRTLIELERTICRSACVRRIVTQSRIDADLIRRHYGVAPERIRTIPNGIDAGLFHRGVRKHRECARRELGLPPGALVAVFASMDFAGKKLDTVLRALGRTRDGDWHLLVLGDGPIARFGRLARRMGIAGRVVFAGRRPDMPRMLAAGDVFVLPTLYEPFPNVVLEAMACGLPVITTPNSGAADLIEPGINGWMVHAPDDDQTLAACLERYASLDAASRMQMQCRAEQTAATCTFDRTVEATLSVFAEVLDEKQRA